MSRPPVQRVHSSLLARRFRRGLVLHAMEPGSGRRYDVRLHPVTLGGRLCAVTDGEWKSDLRGGAPVEVTIDRDRRRAKAELVEDPGTVARAFLEHIEDAGVRYARRLGIRVNVARNPTLHELRDAISRSGLSIVYLDVEW